MATAHGVATNYNESVWSTGYSMPRFYPNVITMQKGIQIDDVIESIAPNLPAGSGVKNSFDELKLEDLGFRSAFQAHWYCRPPGKNVTKHKESKLELRTVNSQADLRYWVSGWGQGDGIFNSSIAADECVELIYATQGGDVLSGLVINHSEGSVGISNIFGTGDALLTCLAAVVETHSSKGIVGYGDENEIATLSVFGFEKIGDLRVWIKEKMQNS
ncbi:MAG: hypothetical protein AB8B84_13355 [Granulosicoccus sp.]